MTSGRKRMGITFGLLTKDEYEETGDSKDIFTFWLATSPTNLALERFGGSTITGGNQASPFNI